MELKTHKVLKAFRPGKILIPIVIGLGVASYLLFRDFDAEAVSAIEWTGNVFFWLFMALLMMVVRDLAYMIRIRILTDNQLTLKRSFIVIMLWEFASAITPSIVGGTAFALLILNKEGISAGKSTSIVMVTAFLDELFFVIMVPLLFLLVGFDALFNPINQSGLEEMTRGSGMFVVFSVAYVLIFLYTLLLAYGLFVNPRGTRWLLIKIFSLPVLRKWRVQASEAGQDLYVASYELRTRNFAFWFKAFMATFFSWTGRYMVVNCMILAFAVGVDHFLIYARQLVMWIIMMVSPTPGSSGVAELVFINFLSDFIPVGLADPLGVLWRLITYYPYIFIGAIMLPRWIRNKFMRHEKPVLNES
ncbi:MAG: lysylphosphatidylglycerol synthase transmembrane domain-containing protein [Bacteroidia bacterium]